MNQTRKWPTEGFKVVVLEMDADPNLVDMLIGDINSTVGRDIAVKCKGTPGTVLQRANRDGTDQVLFYGSLEQQRGSVTVRDMKPRVQYEIPLESIVPYIASCYRAA